MPKVLQGYSIEGSFALRGGSYIAIGSKGGKSYQIKVYNDYKYPKVNSGLPKEVIEEQISQCRSFKKRREDLREALRKADPGSKWLLYPSQIFLCQSAAEFEGISGVIECTPFLEGCLESTSSKDNNWPYMHSSCRLSAMISSALALQCLHRGGIRHGDIKPENILLQSVNDHKVKAILIDFDHSTPKDLVPDTIGGTPNYMSPEVIEYDKAADRYSQAKTKAQQAEFYNEDNYQELKKTADSLETTKIECGKRIGLKADIYALGVVYLHWLTNGVNPQMLPHDSLGRLIGSMIHTDPKERPDIDTIVEQLQAIVRHSEPRANGRLSKQRANGRHSEPRANGRRFELRNRLPEIAWLTLFLILGFVLCSGNPDGFGGSLPLQRYFRFPSFDAYTDHFQIVAQSLRSLFSLDATYVLQTVYYNIGWYFLTIQTMFIEFGRAIVSTFADYSTVGLRILSMPLFYAIGMMGAILPLISDRKGKRNPLIYVPIIMLMNLLLAMTLKPGSTIYESALQSLNCQFAFVILPLLEAVAFFLAGILNLLWKEKKNKVFCVFVNLCAAIILFGGSILSAFVLVLQ